MGALTGRFHLFTLADMEAAQQRMIHARVRLLLVTDMSGNVLGLVTARDLLSEKPIRIAVDDGLARDAVTAARVMVPRERIQVLDYSEVRHSLALEQGPVPTIRDPRHLLHHPDRTPARRAERGVGAGAELRRGRASAGGKLSRPRGSPPSPPPHLWSRHGGGTMAIRGTGPRRRPAAQPPTPGPHPCTISASKPANSSAPIPTACCPPCRNASAACPSARSRRSCSTTRVGR
ncbi:hypothetical protein THIX_60151 [Thiomonas sp. X19]|nr:hypothetical protein THIX_60151 [Thiomonas sp. X19]